MQVFLKDDIFCVHALKKKKKKHKKKKKKVTRPLLMGYLQPAQ